MGTMYMYMCTTRTHTDYNQGNRGVCLLGNTFFTSTQLSFHSIMYILMCVTETKGGHSIYMYGTCTCTHTVY